MDKINNYTIQEWLFNYAEGKFDIDLGESGIQYHHFHDLDLSVNHDLNYSSDRGKSDLREIIANIYKVSSENVLITHGAQEALYLFYRSFINKGDNVITFYPGWQQSWEAPKAAGASVTKIKLSSSNNYKINMDDIRQATHENTRLIILNNPHNPTGVKIPKETLSEIIQHCEKNNIFLMCDEEYYVDYSSSLCRQFSRAGIVSSLSKVYGFPGLRLGWFIGPKEIVEDMVNYKRYITVSNSSLCEYLAMDILLEHKKHLKHYEEIVKQGYNTFEKWTRNHSELKVIPPEGTPFAYLSLPKKMDSFVFSKKLLSEKRTLVMPGEVFEDVNALRISFGRPSNILIEGLDRISDIISMDKVCFAD